MSAIEIAKVVDMAGPDAPPAADITQPAEQTIAVKADPSAAEIRRAEITADLEKTDAENADETAKEPNAEELGMAKRNSVHEDSGDEKEKGDKSKKKDKKGAAKEKEKGNGKKDAKRSSKGEKRDSKAERRDSKDVRRDSKDVRQDSKDVRRDSKDVRRDSKDVRRDSKDVRRDSKDVRRDSKDVRRDSKAEKRLSKDEKRMSKDVGRRDSKKHDTEEVKSDAIEGKDTIHRDAVGEDVDKLSSDAHDDLDKVSIEQDAGEKKEAEKDMDNEEGGEGDEVKSKKKKKGKKGKKGKKSEAETEEEQTKKSEDEAKDKTKKLTKTPKKSKETKAEMKKITSQAAMDRMQPTQQMAISRSKMQASKISLRTVKSKRKISEEIDVFEVYEEEEEESENEEECEEEQKKKKPKRRDTRSTRKTIFKPEPKRKRKHARFGFEGESEEEESTDFDDDLFDMPYEDEDDDGVYTKVKLTERQLKNIYRAITGRESLDEESDSSDDSSDVPSYVHQYSVEDLPDFFDTLGYIPDIEDMTITTMTDEQERRQEKLGEEEEDTESPEYKRRKALEAFMAQLRAGDEEDISLKQKEMEEKSDIYDEYGEDEGGDMWLSSSYSTEGSSEVYDPELDNLPEYSEDLPFITMATKATDDEVLHELLVMETDKPPVVEVIDEEEYNRSAEHRIVVELTQEFLNALITKTLDYCESEAATLRILHKLDKRRMMDTLVERLEELEENMAQMRWLSRRASEFYRRKKALRYITEDPPKFLDINKERLETEVKNLDMALARLQKTRRQFDETVVNLQRVLDERTTYCNERAAELERLMRRALSRDNFPTLNDILERQIKKMFQLHQEVSDMRLSVIEKQHTIGYYIKKFAEINDLGNGLRMIDFEYFQTDVQALGKKVEERNAELNRCRIRFNEDLHITAHVREKEERLCLLIVQLEEQLDELIFQKSLLRERAHEGALKRKSTRAAIEKVSTNAGLLYRPQLMLEYDDTVDRVHELQDSVIRLREVAADYEKRIAILEEAVAAENN